MTRTRRLLHVAGVAVALSAMAMPASAHPGWYVAGQEPPTYNGDVRVVTGEPDVPITRQSDNVEFIAHVPVLNASDMQFQRRDGQQVLRGEVIDRRLDIIVIGGISSPGIAILDITDPTAPEILTTVSCGGFHSEVVLYDNLLMQSWDGSGPGCAEDEPADPDEVNIPGDSGVRIYDLTDPASPRLVRFIGRGDGVNNGVHNLTVNNDAGLLYLNQAELEPTEASWGYVDLNDPAFPVTQMSIRDISPTAGDGCHDMGIAPARKLAACAAITASYVWDISDPRNPVEVAVIPNPAISIHHGSRWTPDEQYLVLNDELGGAAVAPGCLATGATGYGVIGATWFYDTTVPQVPIPVGAFSTSDFAVQPTYPCTSHFYGFTSENLMTVGWYRAGIEIVDFNAAGEGLPPRLAEHAYFEPEGSGFWSAYAWNGYVFGTSHDYGLLGSDDANPAVGLWIIRVDGLEDTEPVAVDEGNTWARWTSAAEPAVAPTDAVAPGAPAPEPAQEPLPATGGGLAALGIAVAATVGFLRRRH